MRFDDPFLDELRLMVMEGATVSRLIRHIAAHAAEGCSLHQSIQDGFDRAFGVGPLRISRKFSLDDWNEETFASLNRFLNAEIIERFPQWGSHLAGRTEPFWKGLQIKPGLQFVEEARPEEIPELKNSWNQLDPEAQRFLKRTLGNLGEMFQNVEILARLSERLQSQIVESTSDPARIEK